jgi:hypothetical protein
MEIFVNLVPEARSHRSFRSGIPVAGRNLFKDTEARNKHGAPNVVPYFIKSTELFCRAGLPFTRACLNIFRDYVDCMLRNVKTIACSRPAIGALSAPRGGVFVLL